MTNAVIVSAARTPIGRAFKGSLANVRSDTFGAHAVRHAVARAGIEPADVEDLLLGTAMTEGIQGLNLARQVGVLAGLPDETAASTINRFCASSAYALGVAANHIRNGESECIVAGGTESMSMIPMTGLTPELYPHPELLAKRKSFYLPMGLTAENVAKQYGVSRPDMDAWGVRSHNRAEAARAAGLFQAEIAPMDLEGGRFEHDEGIRSGATLEATSSLKPVFREDGTVTAGNASQMSDGAGALVVTSEAFAEDRGLKILATVEGGAVAGVPAEIMGIGPVPAIRKLTASHGWTVDDFDHIELNEAFAAQALACIRELELPEERVNPHGGAIAIGHPLGATGSRLASHIVHHNAGKDALGLVTMCVGGGQGYALALRVH